MMRKQHTLVCILGANLMNGECELAVVATLGIVMKAILIYPQMYP